MPELHAEEDGLGLVVISPFHELSVESSQENSRQSLGLRAKTTGTFLFLLIHHGLPLQLGAYTASERELGPEPLSVSLTGKLQHLRVPFTG